MTIDVSFINKCCKLNALMIHLKRIRLGDWIPILL